MIRRAAWAVMFCALPALAQQAPDAGSILRDVQKPLPEFPKKPPPKLEVEQPTRPTLAQQPSVRFVLKAVRITGNSVFAEGELQKLVADLVGKEVSFADLEQAAARITRYYRERGYLVARAYLPQQEIRDGLVEIAVLEGRFGKSQLNNASRVSDATVLRYLAPLEGGVVDDRRVERQLLLLGDLAGMGTAAAALKPGERVGETTLGLQIGEAPLAAGGVEVDNYGSRYTGRTRFTGQLDVLSPFGQGDSASAQGIKADGLELIRLAYQVPVGGHGFRVGASYSDLDYRLGEEFEGLHAHGRATTAAGTLFYPFVRAREANFNGQLSFTRRTYEDRVDTTGLNTDKTIGAVAFTLGGDSRDARGGGGVNTYLATLTAGRLNIDTPAARAIDEASVHAQGSYRKLNLSAQRIQHLALRWSGMIGFSGQLADHNLDSSEKFTLGGPFGVRAYPLGEAAADEGFIFNAEPRYELLPGRLQALAFYDVGRVRLNHDAPPGTTVNYRSLAAAGAGVNWTPRRDLVARLVFAFGHQAAQSEPGRHPRLWAQGAVRF